MLNTSSYRACSLARRNSGKQGQVKGEVSQLAFKAALTNKMKGYSQV